MTYSNIRKNIITSIAIGVAFVLAITVNPLSAQVFPVQANINVTPPYTVYLSHYTAPDQQRVMASVLLHDPVVTSLDVRFRFTIEGAGIRIYTNPGWIPAPFTLRSGITELISADIIAEYFRPQNVIAEGINPQELFRKGKLPEGFYQFKIEVLEYQRGVPISNVGRTGVWLLLSEPPRVVFPTPNQKVNATNPQILNFTWVPGGVASPLSALSTMYEFTLVELMGEVDPTVAITTASDAIKFTRTQQQTTLLYGPGEPQLTPGKSYAYRVRAYNTDGYELFKNNGYSEVGVFQFGDACNTPAIFTLKDETQSTFSIDVVADPGSDAWQAQFRESGDEAGQWSELKAEPGTSTKTVKGLKASTTYQVQLKSLCGTVSSSYTTPQTITTKGKENTQRSCENSVSPFVVSQAQPLQQLKPNDIFLAALMPIKVTEVTSQGGGKFSGKGIATVPLFSAGLAVQFTDIGINELMQLTAGEVVVERNAVNVNLFGDTDPTGNGSTTGNGTATDTTGNDGWPEFTDTINISSDIDSVVVVNDTTVWVYTSGGGEPVIVDMGGSDCLLIVPADGNLDNAQVVYNGAAKPYSAGSGSTSDTDEQYTGFRARFAPALNTQYGFDSLRVQTYANQYNDLEIDGKTYKLPWKALPVNIPDPVTLHIRRSADSDPYSDLKVGVLGGNDLLPTAGANTATQTYNLTGTTAGDQYAVVATYDQDGKRKYAGGLWAATYQKKEHKLYIVPLPGVEVPAATIGQLQNGLTQIYSQALVSWTVQPLNGFTGVELGDNGLDWADKDMLSSYNAEMNSVISAFKDWKTDADPDAYYLFVVPQFSEGSVEGFMPRNRRFGFVTLSQLDVRLVAHEIGHGAFNLRHTFPEVAQGSTDNLMDYSEGNTALLKPQWDLIHNPETTTGLFDDMEDGAASDNRNIVITKNNEFLPSINKLDIDFKINHGNIGVVTVQILNSSKELLHEEVVPTPLKNDAKYLYTWDGNMNKINNNLISEEKFIISIIQGSKDVTHPDLFGKIKDEKEILVDYTKVQWEKSVVKTWACINSNDYKEYKRDIENKVYDIGFDLLNLDADSPYRKNPLKYIEDNIVEISFLGNKIYVHKAFAEELGLIEKKCSNIKPLSVQISSSFRIGNTLGKDKLSDHCLGLAIDLNPSQNPYLQRKNSDNNVDVLRTIDALCQISTSNSIIRVTDPTILSEINRGFIEKYKKDGNSSKVTGENLGSNFISLSSYLVEKDNYTYVNINNGIIESDLNLLISNYNNEKLSESEFCDQLKIIKSRISAFENFNTIFNSISFIKDYNLSVFNKLNNYISNSNNTVDNLLSSHNKPLSNVSIPNIGIEEYIVFFNKVQTLTGDFKTFGTDIKKIVTLSNDRGALVFEKGFFNIDLNLTQNLLETGNLDWGASYSDYMHFNFKKTNIKQ